MYRKKLLFLSQKIAQCTAEGDHTLTENDSQVYLMQQLIGQQMVSMLHYVS